MTRKKILLLGLAVILIIVLVLIRLNSRDGTKEEKEIESKVSMEINFDEETGLYYLEDSSSGNIIYASYDKDDPSFEFYREHPDYNPNPLSSNSRTLNDFVSYDDMSGSLEDITEF